MIGSMIDLTERKQAEESKAHLAAIVDSSRDAIIGGDLDGTIRSWNKGAEEMYGYSVDEAIRQPISLIVPPDRHERAQRDLAAAIPG
jgi:PAS domain S-box-containing protein